jgi:uncharacterized YigZ family protein
MPNVLKSGGEYIFEEKRSKFIGCCETADTEEHAREYIKRVRAAHKTASHHVYAYGVNLEPLASPYTRHSDDGEPQGTAGLPVLNVFLRSEIIRFVCVVVRYFGGTLLGTGGLTRAYGKAAKGALETAGFEPLITAHPYAVECAYSKLERMKYFCENNGLEIASITYETDCRAVIIVPEADEEVFLRNTDLFASGPPRRL